jgi:hypothetical protein
VKTWKSGVLKYTGPGKVEVHVSGTYCSVDVMDSQVTGISHVDGDEVIDKNLGTVKELLSVQGFVPRIPDPDEEPMPFVLAWDAGKKIRTGVFVRKQIPVPRYVNMYPYDRRMLPSYLETPKEISLEISFEPGQESVRAVTLAGHSTIAKYIPDVTEFVINTPKYPFPSDLAELEQKANVMINPLRYWLSTRPIPVQELHDHLFFLRSVIQDLMQIDAKGTKCPEFQKWANLKKITEVINRQDLRKRLVREDMERTKERGVGHNIINKEYHRRGIEVERPRWQDRAVFVYVKLLITEVNEDNPSRDVQWWLSLCLTQKAFFESTLLLRVSPNRLVRTHVREPRVISEEEALMRIKDHNEPGVENEEDDYETMADDFGLSQFLKDSMTTAVMSDMVKKLARIEDELKEISLRISAATAKRIWYPKSWEEERAQLQRDKSEYIERIRIAELNMKAKLPLEQKQESKINELDEFEKMINSDDLEDIYNEVPDEDEEEESLKIAHDGLEDLSTNKENAFDRRHFPHPFWDDVLIDPKINKKQLYRDNVPEVNANHIMALLRWVLDYPMETTHKSVPKTEF